MKHLKRNEKMKSARTFFNNMFDFSDASKGLETVSTIAMVWTVSTLTCRTVMNFEYYDYAAFAAMGVLYYMLQESYKVVPLHQVPVSKNSKSTKNKHLNEKNVCSESREAQKQETLSNRKKKQAKGKNAHLDNSEVQKKENFSKMESKKQKESSEKLMLEARMSGTEYTSGYLEICKYFEEVEDDAVRDKKIRLACKLTDHGFDLDKVIDAAKNCDNFDTATHYLMQKCDSCAKFVSMPEIVQMFMCTHKFCKGCIKHHVATAMKGRNILDCTCKVCEMPKLECVEQAVDYLSTLDRYLESILPGEMHEQFHREFISGTWKTRLKSKESKPSSQHEVNSSWQTVPKRQRGNSSAQSTGPVTRSQTQAAKYSNAVNLSTPQFEPPNQHEVNGSWLSVPIRQHGNSSSQSTGAMTRSHAQAAKNSNLTTTQIEGSTGTTADNDNDWPKLGSRFNKNSTDFPILGSDSSCSFCGRKPDSVLQLYNMIRCEHKLCRSCTTARFSQLILKADIIDCVCPVCRKPEFHSQEDIFNYFKDFRKNVSYILDAGTQESLERKFKDFIENMNGDYGTRTTSYADAKPNERENCNQLQRTCLHNKTPGVAPFKLLCGDHSRCVDCLKEAISSENILEFVCDICYKGNREAQLEVMHQDKGFNLSLKAAVGTDFYKIFTSCLDRRIEQKECDSKFSSAISSRYSLNDYVEKRHTTCPNCRVHCDLTRHIGKWIKCHRCKVSFCGICKAYYNNRCEKTFCFKTFFHLHHHEICYYKKDKFGIDRLKLILKANKVDFVDTEPVSGVCLLREVYHCQSKTFRSDLCRYHYEDYLVNLILQNNLKTSSNWF